jgi:hypothetical protein
VRKFVLVGGREAVLSAAIEVVVPGYTWIGTAAEVEGRGSRGGPSPAGVCVSCGE